VITVRRFTAVDSPDDQGESLHPTWGVSKLASANFAALEDVVDKVAAKRGAERAQLRNALADWMDYPIAHAVEEYEVAEPVIREAAARCQQAVKNQYPEQLPPSVATDSKTTVNADGDRGVQA